ncbi:permease [Pseudoalteromonas rubra]|uniref:Probable membrane transporter protein n=1 Tax=Pseudoalteromonas rubra TaxID=43658 RepID=A0A5S3WN08_9GAMM|nr:sulfite exporter TauE/SafE family protein [Pseudoalteromonas rubra]TMP28558.1 permease [Pseudoalteromonas rubra]TMP30525.1 permease [Pseudoalteromonas rubra]
MLQNTFRQKISKRSVPLLVYPCLLFCWLLSLGPGLAVSNFYQQIQIALTMVFGSFIAGGTALGGGAVAFPVMTKVLSIEPSTAKVFSLGIQSFGMVAATLTILFFKIRFYHRVVYSALLGAIPGVIISLTLLGDLLPRLAIKSLFSVLLILFAVTLIKQLRVGIQSHLTESSTDYQYIPLVGFIGGLASGLVGSGADIFIFAYLVLMLKKEIKVATATSVIIMAITSVVGTMTNMLVLNTLTPEIQLMVHAAIPVVILGAPLGALVCAKLPERGVVNMLLLLIALETGFTAYECVRLYL